MIHDSRKGLIEKRKDMKDKIDLREVAMIKYIMYMYEDVMMKLRNPLL